MKTHQAARFEAALGVLGMRIANLSSAHAVEMAKAQPDRSRLATIEEDMNRLTDEQEALGHRDTARIDQLLASGDDRAT